jgi:drug/metabolite transporter (DMT)-like permease
VPLPSHAGVLLLTKLLLGARYRVLHYFGAAVCIGGLALLVVADDAGAQQNGDTNPLLGDVLVLIGALLYALGNVAQEHLLGEPLHACAPWYILCCIHQRCLSLTHACTTLSRPCRRRMSCRSCQQC